MIVFRSLLIGLAVCAVLSRAAGAATLPVGFTETQISGLSNATAMALHPDGRIFVCQQTGELRVIKNGVVLPTPFLTLPVNSVGERGLLGIAFDPNYATNRFVYVYYTATSPAIHNRVSRFTADSANEDVAIAGSEVILLDLENLSASNHNGGAIHFGPDGKLYVATGENAVPSFSQSLANRLGKILRINSDGTIPADNPSSFPNIAGSPVGVNRAIWAVGLRNPFTFAFQPGTTRMFINDVGQNAWEEINDGIAGSNYGWPNCEGACSSPNANFRDPLFQYGHGFGSTTGCAIAGGAFYNPTTAQFPASYVGKYFFADLCSGWIRLMDPSNNTATGFASGISNPVDLAVASDGSLYYLARGSSSVFRVQFTGTGGTAPSITTHPSNQTVAQGAPATFSVVASGSTPFSYQWQRNQQNISGATSSSYTLPSAAFADNGAVFRCIVTNAFGNATSNAATLTVNAPPSITGHPSNQTVAQGQPATFTVTATGSATLSYQWQRNQQDISGATSSSYTLPSASFADNGATFRCIVTNAFGNATSNEATLTVNAPPSITGHPSNQTVTQGQPATFGVTATGSTPLSYQWQRDQSNISGATSSSYTLPSASFADNGAVFRCIVTNAFGNATSNAATLTVNAPPAITGHPSDLTVTQGQPATFGVTATGSTPFSYQWQRNMTNIAGATSSSYTISSATMSDNGAKFRCVVTNAFGFGTSNEATLTVQPPPPIIETEPNSDRAVALTLPMAVRDPFPLLDPFNLSSDNRTRVMFFVRNLDVVPGDDLTAGAEDAGMNVYQLTIEFAGKVPDFTEFTQVIVILPNNLPTGQDVLLSVTWHNQTSNKARIRIRESN